MSLNFEICPIQIFSNSMNKKLFHIVSYKLKIKCNLLNIKIRVENNFKTKFI